MVDRVYQADLPRLRKALEELREAFSELDASRTDWVKLRIDPLLRHAESLERLLHSRQFSLESTRLRRGVEFFHSDLVYLRANVKGLQKVLQSEMTSSRK